ncbi:MAG: LamG-like jellyroll fold domain-containing protein, partial [Candidatus Hodarchaeales archaeon]
HHKYLSNKHRLLLLINLIFVISILFPFFSVSLQKINPEVDTLAISAGEITIITPENITYTGPMTGYFPATHGFESDTDGTFPSSLTNIGTYPISVISSRSGHNKVVWFDDNGYSYRASCDNKFDTNITHGIIELWFLIDDASDRTGLILRQDTNDTVNMGTRYDKWKYHTATELDLNMQKASGGDMDSPLNNVWHHVRIAFESTTGNYLGLDQYTWKCWIDGIESATMGFRNNKSYVDNFYMSTSWAHTGYNMYIDGIGYSWDPHYNVGDNLKEGLLLDYDNSINLDWKGYSLDGNANITILGDTVFNMPEDGLHTVQVFGNNTLGTMYSSNLSYFSTDLSPQIITPQNTTYNELMSGYYPSTYGFENDRVGDDPYGWTVSEPGLQNVEIISTLDGHNNVLEIFDTESSTTAQAFASNNFAPQTSGTIEFWYRTGGFPEDQTFRVESSSDISIYFGARSGNFQYRNASDWQDLVPFNTNQWYHIRLDFDCASDTYDFYLDGNLIKSNLEFYITVSSLEKIIFLTRQWGTSNDYYTYVDALGYSWDPHYSIGDNLNEGLLLSYDLSTTLDWRAYSLDGQTNKTILGNSTIVMPSNGLHSIQVVGNDSLGESYESESSFFTVHITHSINITSPESKTYVGPMAGYYPATYGFENEENGDIGTEVDFITRYDSDHPAAYAVIEDSINGHNQVLKFYDAA